MSNFEQVGNRILSEFRDKMLKIADECLGEVHAQLIPWIEDDALNNLRIQLLEGLKGYPREQCVNQYDWKAIRQKILAEHREDIIKDLNQDLLNEVTDLKKQIEYLRKWNDRSL